MYAIAEHLKPAVLTTSRDLDEEALGLALYEVAKRKWPHLPMGSYYIKFNNRYYAYDPLAYDQLAYNLSGLDTYSTDPELGAFIGSVGKVFKDITKSIENVMPKFVKHIKLHEVGGIFNPIRLAKVIGRPKDLKLLDFLPGARLIPKDIRTKYGKTALTVAAIAGVAVAGWYLAPAVIPILTAKLGAAGSILGKTLSIAGPFISQVLKKLSPSQQGRMVQQITPEQIVEYEQYQTLPPDLQAILDEANKPAVVKPGLPPPQPTYADLWGPRGEPPEFETAKKGIFAGMSTTEMLMFSGIGLTLFLMLTGQMQQKVYIRGKR